jgi:hypothetical protein
MKGNARSRYGLKGLLILGVVAGVVGCSRSPSNTAATESTGVMPGPGPDLANLEQRVKDLEAYRVKNAAFVGDLYASYRHFYYCDNNTHQDKTQCDQMGSHIQPPQPPAPK